MTTTATYTPIVPASRRTQFAFSLATLRSDEHTQIGSHASNLTQNYSPVILCSTAKMSEEEWLRWRTTGIGGSDALPLRWGHALEETVAEEFSIQTGLRVYEVKEMYQHPLYPFMLANVDRFIDLPDGSVGILECKTANPNSKSKWEDGGVPFHYECQVRHYMAVMNINVAYIACLFENHCSQLKQKIKFFIFVIPAGGGDDKKRNFLKLLIVV